METETKINNQLDPRKEISISMVLSLLAGMVVLVLGDVLCAPASIVLSAANHDLATLFGYMRDFAAHEVLQGNIPLWNTHIYAGIPFFAGVQAALLYLPNIIYLILPVYRAVNWSIALHLWAMGFFMYVWCRVRGYHTNASVITGILAMFCGPFYLHVFPGSLPNISTMVWMPLIFASIDGVNWNSNNQIKWILIGMLAVAMQVFAGHPQYVFYTGITACLYFVCTFMTCNNQKNYLLGFIAIYLGGLILSAVQLMPAIEATSESVRANGLSYPFASMFALPPENLLTMWMPGFFGNAQSIPYWGRCYLWEMTPFFSITGFCLAMIGFRYGDKRFKTASLVCCVVLLILALGKHTPLFYYLYQYAPGFNRFRGIGKFIFPMVMILIVTAGDGVNMLLREDAPLAKHYRKIGSLMSGVSVLLLAVLITGWLIDPQVWQRMMVQIFQQNEGYLTPQLLFNRDYLLAVIHHSLFTGGIALVSLAVLSLCFFKMIQSPKWVLGIMSLAVLEMLVFAWQYRPVFDWNQLPIQAITNLQKENPGDYRIFNPSDTNISMSAGTNDLWGYDPGVSKRYAELLAFSQGQNPDNATNYVDFKKEHRIFNMLRCRFLILPTGDGFGFSSRKDYLPHALLLSSYELIKQRDDIFRRLSDDSFDFSKSLILEEDPGVRLTNLPQPGMVKIRNMDTDRMEIEAEVMENQILLVTDNYSKGWKIKALPGSSQPSYRILSANYVLMAVPLNKGTHKIMMEYKPDSFVYGRLISLLGWVLYLAALVIGYKKWGYRK